MEFQDLSQQDVEKMQEEAIEEVKNMHKKAMPEEKTYDALRKEPTQRNPKINPIGNFLSLDKDKAMILPLLLLLAKENSDSVLLLALMYIIS